MSGQSTVPAFKAALLAQLAARPALAGVQIAWGSPTSGTPSAELMWLGDVRLNEQWNQVPDTGVVPSTRQKREDYTMELVISVVYTTTDQSEPTTRAFAIYAEVEAALRSDPKVSSTVQWAGPGAYTLTEPSTQTTCEARIVAEIRVRAYK